VNHLMVLIADSMPVGLKWPVSDKPRPNWHWTFSLKTGTGIRIGAT